MCWEQVYLIWLPKLCGSRCNSHLLFKSVCKEQTPRVWIGGQRSRQRCPDLPPPSHHLLFQGIPWQAKWHNVHSLSVPGLFPDTTKTPLRPIQMPNLPQLTPSSVEKLCLYSVPLSNDREPRPSPVHCSVSLNCESCKACREESHTSNMGFEKKHPQLATLHFL